MSAATATTAVASGHGTRKGWSGINSFFLVNAAGKVIVEKHWRGVTDRAVLDTWFRERLRGGGGGVDGQQRAEPVLRAADGARALLHVCRSGMFYLCVVGGEAPPLFVLEFLHSIADILLDYFGDISESTIKEHFVTVYQLLEEMMDDGYPITTEPSVLKEFIPPPNMLNTVISTVAGAANASHRIPNGSYSNSGVPWRRVGVRHLNNEIFLDIVEKLDAILDANGRAITCEVFGAVKCNSKLSGMPELVLSFVNPRVIDDYSLHPCVRFRRFETERVLSFVPPDGRFTLMSYMSTISSSASLPLSLRPQMTNTPTGGKLDLVVSPRTTDGKPIEDVVVVYRMSHAVDQPNFSCNVGQQSLDPTTKTLTWVIGKVSVQERIPMLSGTFTTNNPAVRPGGLLTVSFMVNLHTVSGLRVDSIQVYSEPYKPYKGVRSITKAGTFEMRI